MSPHAGADGIIYASCRGTDGLTLERLFHDVGRMLGGPVAEELREHWADPARSLPEKVRHLLSKLRRGAYLLVLDNLEDLLSADRTVSASGLSTFLEECLATPHGLKLLGTSRDVVAVAPRHARAVRVVPLEGGLPDADAVALLRELDPEGRLGLREASDERLLAAARACFGIPRPLEAVAGLLANDPTLTLEQLLGHASLFTDHVVESLVAEHYAALSNDRRRVLEALAVYGKAVPAAAVRFLLQPSFPEVEVEECLSLLARNYFLTFHRGQGTYELHPIDQQHSYAQIPDEGAYSKGSCHRRAAEFYTELGKPEGEWRTLEDLQPQLDEFEQRVRAGDYKQAGQLLTRFDFHHLAVWGYSELVVSLRQRLVGRLADTWEEIDNWAYLGYAFNRLRAAPDAIRCFEAALRLLEEVGGSRNATADLKGNLGRSFLLLGRVEEARAVFEEVVSVSRTYSGFLGGWASRIAEGLWSGRLAEALLVLGRTEEALGLLQTALHISQVEWDSRWLVSHRSNLADAHRRLGNHEAALRYSEEGLDLALQTGNRQGEGFCALRRGQVLHELGRLAEARADYERGKRAGLPPVHYTCSVRLGILCLEEGKATEAGENFALGISLCRVLLDRAPGLYDALFLLALAQLGSCATTEALATYRRAILACSAEGTVQDALHDLRQFERSRDPVPGLASAFALFDRVP